MAGGFSYMSPSDFPGPPVHCSISVFAYCLFFFPLRVLFYLSILVEKQVTILPLQDSYSLEPQER